MKNQSQYYSEIASELNNILQYWKDFSVDKRNGGFVGQRDHYNREITGANKGVILNTRLLWTFSAIGNFKQQGEMKFYADRAFLYLKDHFKDRKYGGIFWELDAEGNPVNRRKQIYAQAFGIYSLSEYYLFSKEPEAKEMAIALFKLLEEHALDRYQNGYFEAFQEDWTPIEDMRLSKKDRNSAKTMNTHLHILEAYTLLLSITDDTQVKKALENLVLLFLEKFYNENNQHFQLFFDEQWHPEGNVISYGHEIEALWLLIEAAKAVRNKNLLQKTKEVAVNISNTFLKEAYVPHAGIINEKDTETEKVDKDRHWWPHAEAMVGPQYASEISGEYKFQQAAMDIWNFTKTHIIDHTNGEWFFKIDENNSPYKDEDKLGMWKCPYHNSRACIQLLKNS